MRVMVKIGITGGIGSGKSVVATLLRLYGIPVYIADEESKRLTNSSPVIRRALVDLVGEAVYDADGKLDKPRLANFIFGQPEHLARVNAIIHPEVNRDFLDWSERQEKAFCAIESAILFESGFDRIVDVKLMVLAPLEIRLERAIARDHASREALERRIKSQMADEEKASRSDFVIHNDGRQALIPQVENFIGWLKNRENALF